MVGTQSPALALALDPSAATLSLLLLLLPLHPSHSSHTPPTRSEQRWHNCLAPDPLGPADNVAKTQLVTLLRQMLHAVRAHSGRRRCWCRLRRLRLRRLRLRRLQLLRLLRLRLRRLRRLRLLLLLLLLPL